MSIEQIIIDKIVSIENEMFINIFKQLFHKEPSIEDKGRVKKLVIENDYSNYDLCIDDLVIGKVIINLTPPEPFGVKFIPYNEIKTLSEAKYKV